MAAAQFSLQVGDMCVRACVRVCSSVGARRAHAYEHLWPGRR